MCPPPDLITVATLTMEYPHMQDSDTSGSVGGGILNAGDLRVNAQLFLVKRQPLTFYPARMIVMEYRKLT
ncbi:hypothetical protein CDAR_5541 [Caerostris darwini]|uniref:Uncharacterized protein n=1 Tax=Caerostris darwini TaxID=1538125 RepID=A0AAV4Q521_9ARAC|nr:hypothetical protein CDAR_5541 [Caerostris darwini]